MYALAHIHDISVSHLYYVIVLLGTALGSQYIRASYILIICVSLRMCVGMCVVTTEVRWVGGVQIQLVSDK